MQTIDETLNKIINYVPKQESVKFISWNNMMWGDDEHETPMSHYFLFDEMTTQHKRFVCQMFRGGAKSTITSHKLPLYVSTFGSLPNFGVVHNICLISDTFDQADAQRKTMMAYYERSEELKSFLQVERNVEGESIFVNNKGHRTRVFCKGTGQAFRGSNWEGHRPDLIIADDILNDDILNNKELRTKQSRWWTAVVENAVNKSHFKIIAIGTPLTEDDLINLFTKSSEWHSVMVPVCKEFPVPIGEIQSVWADRFTKEVIWDSYMSAKSIGEEGTFFRELMLQIVSDDTRVFKKEWIKRFKYEEMKKEKNKYNFFTTMDLAVSKKQSADFTVVMTIGVNSEGHWFICKVDRGRFNPSETIDVLFKHVRQFKPIEVRAEKAGIQQVLGHFIDERMNKENTHFYMNDLSANSVQKKELRILGLQPRFKARKIHFPEDICHDEVVALEHELMGFTREGSTTGHDDAIDTLANFLDEGFIVTPSDYAKDDFYEGMTIQVSDPTVF